MQRLNARILLSRMNPLAEGFGEPLAMPSCFHPSQPDQVAEALASLDVASPVVVEVVRLTWAGGLLSEADKALLGSAVEWAGPWIMAAKG